MQFVSNLASLAIATLLIVSLSPGSQAASFDCTKASTPHERDLCADPSLNAADGRMGESYRAAVRSFPVKDVVQANGHSDGLRRTDAVQGQCSGGRHCAAQRGAQRSHVYG